MARPSSSWLAIGIIVLVPTLLVGGWWLIAQAMSEPAALGLTSTATSRVEIPAQASFVEHIHVTLAAGAVDANGTGSISVNASGSTITVTSIVNDADGSRATTSPVMSPNLLLTTLPCRAGSSCVGHYSLTLQNTGAQALVAVIRLIYTIPYYVHDQPPGRSLVVGLDP
jgi:hypothetical protein